MTSFLSWPTGLTHKSLQNLIDSSASSITCSCLIFPFNSSCKAFWLFLKVLFCWYWFTLDLQCFKFNVFADTSCLSSSMTVLNPLAFILYFFFNLLFNLVLQFYNHPLTNHRSYLNPSSKLQYPFLFSAPKMLPFCLWCNLLWHQPSHKPIMHLLLQYT